MARRYDAGQQHSWYSNLERTVEQLDTFLKPDDLLLDYFAGTSILEERLVARRPDTAAGMLLVDASPKEALNKSILDLSAHVKSGAGPDFTSQIDRLRDRFAGKPFYGLRKR